MEWRGMARGVLYSFRHAPTYRCFMQGATQGCSRPLHFSPSGSVLPPYRPHNPLALEMKLEELVRGRGGLHGACTCHLLLLTQANCRLVGSDTPCWLYGLHTMSHKVCLSFTFIVQSAQPCVGVLTQETSVGSRP